MRQILFFIFNMILFLNAYAIDIYGIDQQESNKILKKYAKEFTAIDKGLQQLSDTHQLDSATTSIDNLRRIKRRVLKNMIKENGYLYAQIQAVVYPENNAVCTTIEIINKNQPERMRFLNDTSEKINDHKKIKHAPDLIDDMINYEAIGMRLILNHELKTYSSCPVYHCAEGFGHPQLKPYLRVFNTGVIQQKALVLNTLNQDKNPERRAAAAFLVGHFSDPREIIKVLSVHVNDRDDGVRNNVMRVIGTTILKAKISDIDPRPFLDALDSPYTTDRNKALGILSVTSDMPSAHQLILKEGGQRLLALLRLKQPNNHDFAYLILKKLSHKDFGSTNVAAWEAWVSSNTEKIKITRKNTLGKII